MEEVELPELPPPDVPDPSGKFCVGWSSVRMREYARQAMLMERERCNADAARYQWLAENTVIQTEDWRHDGKDPASTKQPLDNAIDAAIRKG